MYGKLKKLTEQLLVKLFSKLGEYNLLSSILTLQFIKCVKFNFGNICLWSDSQTNTAIWLPCLHVKMVSKTVIRPIQFTIWSLCGGDSTRPHLSGHGYWRESYQTPLRQLCQVFTWNEVVSPGFQSLFQYYIVSAWTWLLLDGIGS